MSLATWTEVSGVVVGTLDSVLALFGPERLKMDGHLHT